MILFYHLFFRLATFIENKLNNIDLKHVLKHSVHVSQSEFILSLVKSDMKIKPQIKFSNKIQNNATETN